MAWHVAEGDHVVVDQPLVSVETEKAVVEIPSPQSGRIAQLLAKPGEHVQVGAPLLAFEEGAHPDTGTVVGNLSTPAPAPASREATRPRSARCDPGGAGGAGAGEAARCRAVGNHADRTGRQPDDRRCRDRSRGRQRSRRRPARRCAARGAPWRSTWRAPGARSCPRPCTTKPMSTPGQPTMSRCG